MTPYSPGQDVFRTQADTRFNSFADPMNSVNQNPGNWGINSNYMTPAHMSPYRPQYQGPQGDMGGNFNPSWGQSASFMANPFRKGGTNYGGNTWQQQSPFFDTIGNRPMDHAASFTQNTAVPLAATYFGFRGLEGIGSRMGSSFASGAARGIMGGAMASSGAGSMAMSGAGMVGGFAGGVALPMMAAHAAVGAFNGAVMDPYIAQRQMTNNFRNNFAGVNFGTGGASNQYTGGGMSRGFASGMAGQMSGFAAHDLTFNQKEIGGITDLASRGGLLDTSNPQQITSKLKEITRQVKLVMAVANTSDFRDAIEILGKLQMSGATGSAATRAMSAMGGFAAASGISTQKMMNTVGMQGQMLFGANGLTPYVGQMAAGQANASMSAAFRNGLMSPALAARFGGVEGATQSAVSGSLSLANSPYASMYAHNAYHGGGEVGGVVGNMSRFGGEIARGGLKAIGGFNLARPGTMSKMLEEDRLGMTQDTLTQIGKILPGSQTNGKLDSRAAYQILTGTMGVPDQEARAMLQELKGYQHKGTTEQMLAGNRTAMTNSRMKFAEQQGADYGRLTGGVQTVFGVGRNIQAGGAAMVNAFTGTVGKGLDAVQNWYTETKFGDAKDMQDVTMSSLEGTERLNINSLDLGPTKDRKNYLSKVGNRDSLKDVDNQAKKGNAAAIAFIKSNGTDEEALMQLVKDGHLDPSYEKSLAKRQGLAADLKSMARVQGGEGSFSKAVEDAYGGITAVSGVMAKGKYAELVGQLNTMSKEDQGYSDKVGELSKLLGKDLGPIALKEELASKSAQAALANGTMNQSGVTGIVDDADLDERIKKAGSLQDLAKSTLDEKHLKAGITTKEQYISALADQKGGAISHGKMKNVDHVSAKDLAIQRQSESELRKQRDRIQRLAADHKIDFSTESQMSAAVDNKEAVGKFASAVDLFQTSVNALANHTTVAKQKAEEDKVRGR